MQQPQEQDRAQHAQDGAGRHLVGVDDQPPRQIAAQDQHRPGQRHNGQGGAQVVAHDPRHQVRHDQAHEGDHPHRRDHHRGQHRHHRQPKSHHRRRGQAQPRRHLIAQAKDREAVGREPGQPRRHPRDPQQFIAPRDYAREFAAEQPSADILHQVALPAHEGHDRAQHPRQDQPRDGDQHHLAHGQAADHGQKQRGRDHGRQAGRDHAQPQGTGGPEDGDGQKAKRRALGRARRVGADEAVPDQRLDQHPRHRQRGPGQHHRQRARQARFQQDQQGLRIAERLRHADVGSADRQAGQHQRDQRRCQGGQGAHQSAKACVSWSSTAMVEP